MTQLYELSASQRPVTRVGRSSSRPIRIVASGYKLEVDQCRRDELMVNKQVCVRISDSLLGLDSFWMAIVLSRVPDNEMHGEVE